MAAATWSDEPLDTSCPRGCASPPGHPGCTPPQGTQLSLPECDGAGYELLLDSTPRVGTRYLVFLTADQGGDRWAPTAQYARLEIRDGKVYSAQFQQPPGLSWTDVQAVPLSAVVQQIATG